MSGLFDHDDPVKVGEAVIRAEAMGLKIKSKGGNCPVQIDGWIDGNFFYFRARGDNYQVHICGKEEDLFNNELYYADYDWGEWPEAGWMDLDVAIHRLCDEIDKWRKMNESGEQKE